MIKLAVFDWNGTILADLPAVVEGVNKELAVIKQVPITVTKFQEVYDMPLVNGYMKLGITRQQLTENREAMSQAFHSFYEPRVAKARTRQGTRAVLDMLHHRGIARIMLSNHTVEGIYLQLERLKLSHHFEAILANEAIGAAYFAGKEARLKNYLQTQHIKPDTVVIIGDTVEEIKIARRLGIKSVAITGGYHTAQRLRLAKPDALITKLMQLPAVLEDM